MKQMLLILAVSALCADRLPAQAQLNFVSSAAALGGNDSIDWTQLGPTGTTLDSPATVTTASGESATVSSSGLVRATQDSGQGTDWQGNFAPGTQVLWNGTWSFYMSPGTPIVINFATSVNAVGAEIQSYNWGAFTWTISAYDSSHNLLGSFDGNGTAGHFFNDTVPFVGVSSSCANISEVDFTAFLTVEGLAIGPVSIKGAAPLICQITNGVLMLNCLTRTNTPICIEAATNLTPPVVWLPIYTNIGCTNTAWRFIDSNAVAYPHRFYRLTTP